MWRSYHCLWVRHIKAYGAPRKDAELYNLGIEISTRDGGHFVFRADAPDPSIIHPEDYRAPRPDYMDNAEAHMQPYARCVPVQPCATDGVLELLARQQRIRSPPAFSLLTCRMCICKRGSRLTDDCTEATSYGCYRDLFRAITVPSRCISPYSVAQIPAALYHQVISTLRRSTVVGLTELDLRAKAFVRAAVVAPKIIDKTCVEVQFSNTIQFRSCMR